MANDNNSKQDSKYDASETRTKTKGKGNKRYQRKTKGNGRVSEKCDPKRSNSQVLTEFGTNDVKWYQNVPGWENWASIPFNVPLGMPLDINTRSANFQLGSSNVSINPSKVNYSSVVPGVMRLEFAPTYGHNDSADDPINLAAQRVYAAVRRQNSGAANYDKTDLMMLIMAMDSVYMAYENLCRAFKMVGKYNYESRYEPDVICEAMGFSHDFLMSNYNDVAGFIKVLAYKIASINIPDLFDIISRHQWIVSNVYTDEDSGKSQVYLFKPDAYYVWTEGVGNEPTKLVLTPSKLVFGVDPEKGSEIIRSMQQLIDGFNALLNPIMGSEDAALISGDVIKAFGDGKMVKLSYPNEGDVLTFVNDAEVGNEIMNASVIAFGKPPLDEVVQFMGDTVTGPYLKTNPHWNSSSVERYLDGGCGMQLVNLNGMSADASSVLTSTRLKTLLGIDANSIAVYSSGTEIITQATIYKKNAEGSVLARSFSSAYVLGKKGTAALSIAQSALSDVKDLSPFKWAPTLYFWNAASAELSEDGVLTITGPYEFAGCNAEYSNFGRVDEATLSKINDYCLMSLFAPRL